MGRRAAAIPPPTQHFIRSTPILLPFLSFMALKKIPPPSILHPHLHSLSRTSIGLWNAAPPPSRYHCFYFACMPYGAPISKHFYQYLPSFLFYPIHPLTHRSASSTCMLETRRYHLLPPPGLFLWFSSFSPSSASSSSDASLLSLLSSSSSSSSSLDT